MDDDTKPHVPILECMMLVMGKEKTKSRAIHVGVLMIPKDWEILNTPIKLCLTSISRCPFCALLWFCLELHNFACFHSVFLHVLIFKKKTLNMFFIVPTCSIDLK
jgi:hypothetical protein